MLTLAPPCVRSRAARQRYPRAVAMSIPTERNAGWGWMWACQRQCGSRSTPLHHLRGSAAVWRAGTLATLPGGSHGAPLCARTAPARRPLGQSDTDSPACLDRGGLVAPGAASPVSAVPEPGDPTRPKGEPDAADAASHRAGRSKRMHALSWRAQPHQASSWYILMLIPDVVALEHAETGADLVLVVRIDKF